MKMSRICTGVTALVALSASGNVRADAAAQSAEATTVILNTFQTIWVTGDTRGPLREGTPRLGKNTGAGIMDAQFAFDAFAAKANPAAVLLGTVYTRSAATQNRNAASESYMQGGFALATLSETGVQPGPIVDLPSLDGERTFMRPQIAFTPKYAILIAASEDNGINNNPQPVMFIADKATGALAKIPNNTRGADNLQKPTNLIQTALRQGIEVLNPNNQRGPHSIAQVGPNSFVVGMQYNNQAQEAFKVTVQDNGTVTMDWLKRYSNTAQHCRPQVAVQEGANVGFIAAVEANNQPAEIGFRVTKFDVATGAKIVSKIAVRSEPDKNKYVAEPSIAMVGDKLAIGYQLSASVNRTRDGENGHAGGSQISYVNLFSTTDLSPMGEPLANAAAYGRHSTMFATTYGPNAEPAISYIGGSSTGTKGAFEQLIPLKADGSLGLKDPAKLYAVSSYSDVANVQARGKRNPNNQARGFINGLGSIPNPGFGKSTSFMPEVKAFSFSTITGYTDAAGAVVGKRNSIWLSLVPAAWAPGIQTTPGGPTSTPAEGGKVLGPAPRSSAVPTNPAGDATSSPAGGAPTDPDALTSGSGRSRESDEGGCAVASGASSLRLGTASLLLVLAGALLVLRRKSEAL